MPFEGEYEPSPWDWVREQVEAYEESGGREGNTLYYGYTVYDPSVLAEPWKVGPRAIQLNTANGPYNEDPPCIMNPRPMVSRERG